MTAFFRRLAVAVVFCIGIYPAYADDSLSLVAENNWFPYAADRHGVIEGFAVDLVRAAYKAVGRDVNLVSLPYARCLEEVEAGRELGCFDTTREPATEARFLFHRIPLFSSTVLIIGPADSTAQHVALDDLAGQHVAITNGYTYGDAFQRDGMVMKDVVQSDLSVLRVVARKRVAYGIIFDKVMASLMSEHADELAGKVKIVGTLSHQDLYVSFSRTRPDSTLAMDQLDRGLEAIKADGTYQRIEERWNARFTTP